MPDDIASQWKAFSPEQRDQAMAKMSPTQKQQLATSLGYKEPAKPGFWDSYNSAVAPLVEIRPHEVPHSASDVGREVAKGVGNIGAAAFGAILHPYDTVKGAVTSAVRNTPPVELYDALRGKPIASQEMAEQIVHQPLESAEQMIGQAGVTEAVGPLARGLKGTSEAMRRTAQSAVGAGERPVKAAVVKAADTAADAAESVKKANKTADEKTLEARGKVDEKNAEARLDAARQTREAAQANTKEVADTKTSNAEAVRAQDKIAPTQQKLESASSELRGRVETAREKALKVGNEKYSTVNEELSPLSADMEHVENIYQEAAGSIGEAGVEPPLLTRLGKAIGRGEALTYKDMQGLYSELGKELSKGTLPGGTYHAYDLLHEGIGQDMQRLADSRGMGAQLLDARNYWRRMKQTFGKKYNPTDAATSATEKSSPEFARQEAQKNQLRLLGSFDPEIPKVDEHIQNLQKGLAALPKPAPLREVVKPLPAKPEPVIPARTDYAEPNANKPIEVPEVNTRELREKLAEKWATGETALNKFQVSRLVGSAVFGTIIGTIFGRGLGTEVGSVAGSAAYALSPAMVAKIMEKPAVRAWLTKPPIDELEALQKLPNADKVKITDGLNKVVSAAQKRGVKVDPALVALTVGVAGPKTKALQQKSSELRDEQP